MGVEIRVSGLFNTGNQSSLVTSEVDKLQVELGGVVGSKYYGHTKLSDTRDRTMLGDPRFLKGLEIRNWRQWSAVSQEDLIQIAINLGIPKIDPELLGANIYFSETKNFTQFPKGTLIHFPQNAILLVEAENMPCTGPGEEIAKDYNSIRPNQFVRAAMGLRGLVGVIHRPGKISVNDVAKVQIYVPKFYSIP